MENILITGITGYIGSNLARDLIKSGQYRVFGLVRYPLNKTYIKDIESEINFLKYDGTFDSVNQAMYISKPTTVYHLATYFVNNHKSEDIPNLISSNILFGNLLLEAMVVNNVKNIVNTISVAQYFSGPYYDPTNLYAATKQAFQDIVEYYVQAHSISAIHLCLPNTYGPNDLRSKILNIVKTHTIENKELDISAGEQEFDVLYIDDVVKGFLKAGDLLKQMDGTSKIYSLTNGKSTTLYDVVKKFLQVNDVNIKLNWGARPYAFREAMTTYKPKDILPQWKPEISLEKGLKLFFNEG